MDLWTPNKWGAAALGFFLVPSGFLYAARWRIAAAYFGTYLVSVFALLFLLQRGLVDKSAIGIANLVLVSLSAVHSFLVARASTPRIRPWYSRWYGLSLVVLGPLALLVVVRSFWIEPFRIPSTAMAPTIPQGSIMLASKCGFRNYGTFGLASPGRSPIADLSRGELIVFFSPQDPANQFVKRLVGLPGDRVAMRDKALLVNDTPAALSADPLDAGRSLVTESLDGVQYRTIVMGNRTQPDFEITVPEGEYFVLGDNRDASFDSRQFGMVPAESMIGRVVHVF